MTRTRVISPAGFLLAAVLYVAVNIVFNVMPPVVRWDVTEDGLYTLSEGTQQILSEIDEPIEFHFFLSEELAREFPFYATYGQRVRELLAEIAALSGGNLILREYNPKSFSKDEDSAVAFGMQGIPINKGSTLVYFGLAGSNSVDDIERIPFFQPAREKLLEYDLVQMIYALANVEPTTVGVMSSLPIMGGMHSPSPGAPPQPQPPWGVAKRINADFTVVNVPESADELPAEIDILVIVQPKMLSTRAVYEIEQFLFRGGRVLLFLDPRYELDTPPGIAGGDDEEDDGIDARGLRRLLDQWKVTLPEDNLVADKSLAMRINAGQASQPVLTNYLVWLGVPAANINRDDPITSQLSTLNIASAGYLTLEDESPMTMEPLIFSTDNSSPIAVKEVTDVGVEIWKLLETFKPDTETYVMAARLTGEVTTAFPDGVPSRGDDDDGDDKDAAAQTRHLGQSDGAINLIVVADSDFLSDRFWLRKQNFFGREIENAIAGNADFVINAIENLSGDNNLLTLRTRGTSPREFERVKALERRAETRLQDRERVLRAKLKETQNQIAGLEGVRTIKDPDTGETRMEVTLTREQHAEMQTLQRETVDIRAELRTVQRGLREDVERLESWMQFINIGLIPLFIAGIAIMFSVMRMLRARRRFEEQNEATA